MMGCDEVSAAIVDEGLARPSEFQAHLDQCPRCRELAKLHAAASTLTLPESPAPLAPLPPQAILGEVRRRHHRRKAFAGVVAASAVAALALFVTPRKVTTEHVTEVPSAQMPELPPIDLLVDEVESYTQRDLTFDDETYAPFGTLALWVRPSTSTALNDRPFRKALAPLHPSPMQESPR